MKPNVTAIERAFELAGTGRFLYVAEIRHQLRSEGYTSDGIIGPQLCSQLKKSIRQALKTQHKPLPDQRAGEPIW